MAALGAQAVPPRVLVAPGVYYEFNITVNTSVTIEAAAVVPAASAECQVRDARVLRTLPALHGHLQRPACCS